MASKNIPNIGLETLTNMTEKIRKILEKHGINSVNKLAKTYKLKLEEFGIDPTDTERVHYEALQLMRQYIPGFILGEDLVEKFEEREFLTTGCRTLDELLMGGFVTTKIYEFYGPEMVGKTKFLHQLICTAALPKKLGGLESPVIYIIANWLIIRPSLNQDSEMKFSKTIPLILRK